MRWVRRLIGVAVLVALLVGGWRLAAENATEVGIDYLWGELSMPLWQAMLWPFGAGLALGVLGWMWSGLRSGLLQRRYRKTVSGLESELHQLRNLPLTDRADGAEAAGSETGPGARSA